MTAPRSAPDTRSTPRLEAQAAAVLIAAERWWSLYSHLVRTKESEAERRFYVDRELAAAAATMKRLAGIAAATSEQAVEDLLSRAEERAAIVKGRVT